jgi:hypothetical protein
MHGSAITASPIHSRRPARLMARLPLVGFRRKSRDLMDRPDFDGAFACTRNPLGDGNRLVEVPGVDRK